MNFFEVATRVIVPFEEQSRYASTKVYEDAWSPLSDGSLNWWIQEGVEF